MCGCSLAIADWQSVSSSTCRLVIGHLRADNHHNITHHLSPTASLAPKHGGDGPTRGCWVGWQQVARTQTTGHRPTTIHLWLGKAQSHLHAASCTTSTWDSQAVTGSGRAGILSLPSPVVLDVPMPPLVPMLFQCSLKPLNDKWQWRRMCRVYENCQGPLVDISGIRIHVAIAFQPKQATSLNSPHHLILRLPTPSNWLPPFAHQSYLNHQRSI
ncbi:hypothetical protein V8F33_003355 [Rhypophila sp. PSN 637]